jgi:hypothetical protein
MKKIKNCLVLIVPTSVLIFFSFLYSLPAFSQGKITVKEKDTTLPICSGTGTLSCPTGYKPICPNEYKPACIFVINKQLPACLANSTDKTSFSYYLDKISCKKK